MAVASVEIRNDTASLRTDLWASLATAHSAQQIVSAWAIKLQQALDAQWTAIWTNEPEDGPILQAYIDRQSSDDNSLSRPVSLQESVERACADHMPLIISGSSGEPEPATEMLAAHDHASETIVLQPLVSQDRVLGLAALSFEAGCAQFEAFTLQSVAEDMGNILALLQHEEGHRDAKRIADALVEWAPIGICCLDRDCHITSWNSAAEQLFGWRASEVGGRCLPMGDLPEREIFETCCRGALAGHSTRRLETKVRSKNRSPVEVVLSMVPLYQAGGTVAKILICLQDISDRKRAERRLHLQHLVTRLLADSRSVDEAIQSMLALLCAHLGWTCGEFWSAEKNGKVLTRIASWHSSSPAAVQFDIASREWKPNAPLDLAKRVMDEGKPTCLPAISSDRAVDRAALAAQCGFDDAIGFPIVVGGQSAAVVLFFAESIRQPDEQLFVCLTAIAEQIGHLFKRLQTEEALRATEDSLLQAHKMEAMGRLVGGVVHDFNNSLTVILGYSELLLDSTKIPIPSRDAIVEVRNAAKHAANLTKRILSFCRKKTYCPVVLNLNTSVEEMEPMIRRLIGKEIDLRVALAPDLHHVRADPAQIEQVLMNLIINARDAIAGRGRLTLETQNVNLQRTDLGGISSGFPGPYVVLSISDTGTGMDEATQRRIFEPFYTTKPSGTGTGLGLATVRDIMTQCGGDILVESKPGEGTTFRLVYPRDPKGLSPWQVHSAPEAVPMGTETVLVVDDEVSVRRLIGLILQARHYSVLKAANAAEAIDLCNIYPSRIDLLITDIVMPGINGLELADQIQELRSDVKVLVMSAYGERETGLASADRPAWPCLEKPFTSHDLTSVVRRILDQGSARET